MDKHEFNGVMFSDADKDGHPVHLVEYVELGDGEFLWSGARLDITDRSQAHMTLRPGASIVAHKGGILIGTSDAVNRQLANDLEPAGVSAG
jgi:hypothetical protein